MKKSFTFFAISALFLMLLFPVSVKAETIVRYFGYQDGEWTQNGNVEQSAGCCAGYIAASDKIVTGSDFYYSGKHQDAVERDGDNWTGFNGSNGTVKACTRTGVSLSASTTYTFSLLTKDKGEMDITLPKISIDGTKYVGPQKVLVNSVEQSFSNNQYRYTENVETVLEYSITAPSSSSYIVSVQFTSGYRDKFKASTLTITQNAPTYAVTATATNGSVVGIGSYAAGATVTLTPNPNPYYAFSSWSDLTGVSVDGYQDDNPLTFTMPAGAVSVTANFVSSPCTNTKTIQCEDYDNSHVCGSTPVPSTLIINSDHTGYAHDDYPKWHGSGFADFQEHDTGGQIFFPITLPAGTYTFSVICANGGDKKIRIYNSSCSKVVGDISLSNDWGESRWVTATTPAQTLDAGDYYISLYASNHYAAFDQITISATSNVFCPNTITMAKSGDASADDPTSSPASAAMAGTEVTITAGEASANHYFSGWTVSPENAVTFDAPASPTTTFVMPAEDVTITANYEASVSSTFTYTISGSGSITCATESGSSVISGTPISMTAVPSDDYVFTGWTATEGTFSSTSALTTTFIMPSTAAEVTATFAQVDNKITVGSESGSSANNAGGGASITESNISDFDAFAHNVIKLAYSNMSGNDRWFGWNLGKQGSYNSANSAGATGFGFYYKTETDADKVAFCFDYGGPSNQYKVELPATNNVWKYHYFNKSAANNWNGSNIIIYINGKDGDNTTANANGAIYLADIAATSIISKDDIVSYTYTRENTSNSYGTLCLPMAGSVSGATLYRVAGKQEEGGKLYIVLEEQGANLEAGEPYIFEADGSTLTATMSGPHSPVKADANGLVGTYQQITAPVYSEQDNHNYVLALDNSGNTVFKKVGENVTVGAYRAYINIKDASDYSPASAAPGRKYIRFGIEGTEEEQAVEMIYDDASLRTRKIMQNGHLYILRDGHLFTAQGTQIK